MSPPAGRPKGIYERLQQAVEGAEGVEGISAADFLAMPEELARIVQEVVRLDVATLEAIAARVDAPPRQLAPLLEALTQKGYVQVTEEEGTARYEARFARRRKRYVPSGIWKSLADSVDG